MLRLAYIILLSISLFSCGVYNQHIMFQTEGSEYDTLKLAKARAEKSYIIQPHNFLRLDVYTNKGELLIDPNFELRNSLMGGGGASQRMQVEEHKYLVRKDSTVRIPMLGLVKVAGLTVQQVDSLLSNQFEMYYENAFVKTQVINNRVFVLGGSQGGQVIPLENQDMTLIEVLALYGGLTDGSRAHNIRLIRGDLDNPQVQVIDLSTIKGMKKADLHVQPEDIIYIEPVQKVFKESVRDISPIIGVLSNVITLVVLISTL